MQRYTSGPGNVKQSRKNFSWSLCCCCYVSEPLKWKYKCTNIVILYAHVSKVSYLTHNGSEQSRSVVKWCVPPVPLSPGKQFMASRNTWRFARRSVEDKTSIHCCFHCSCFCVSLPAIYLKKLIILLLNHHLMPTECCGCAVQLEQTSYACAIWILFNMWYIIFQMMFKSE